MRQPEIILIGAGGHSRACIDVIEQHGGYKIAGLVGLPKEINTCHLGYPVIATDNDLPELAKKYEYSLITVGQIHTPDQRIRLYQRAIALGFKFPAIIAPSAYVSRHATVGLGTIVMHGAVINAGVMVGDNCIINTRALLEHEATVGGGCHISTGAILNGNVYIGAGSFVGSGCVIKEGVILGKRCVVGMGLSVLRSLADSTLYLG